ncbi:MAG: TlpA disulfide reductase family protein [Bacteroidales bacterium]
MKKATLLVLTILMIISGCKSTSVKVSGKLDNPIKDGYLFLAEIRENSVNNIDSVRLSEAGTFSFSTETEIPRLYVIRTAYDNYFMFAAEPGDNITVEAAYNRLSDPESVKGSETNQKLMDYNKALKGTIGKLQSLTDVFNQNADNPNIEKVVNTLDSTAQVYVGDLNKYTKKFIDDNLTSLVSLVALYQRVSTQKSVLDPVEDIRYFIKVDSSLFRLYPESEPVKALHMQVQELVTSVNAQTGGNVLLEPGTIPPDITLPSPSGESISLSSTRGKIVLLDFWAAWCPPCRKENPNLVMAYNKYHGKGFEIFQVSLDKTKEDWTRAIQTDNLGRWIHVSDLQYWNSEVVKRYKVESIPFNLLLDKDGRIIAMNLRGPKLEEKLSELFK